MCFSQSVSDRLHGSVCEDGAQDGDGSVGSVRILSNGPAQSAGEFGECLHGCVALCPQGPSPEPLFCSLCIHVAKRCLCRVPCCLQTTMRRWEVAMAVCKALYHRGTCTTHRRH